MLSWGMIVIHDEWNKWLSKLLCHIATREPISLSTENLFLCLQENPFLCLQ